MEEKSTAAVIVWTGGENRHGVTEKRAKYLSHAKLPS
jgi:hypothetical protein